MNIFNIKPGKQFSRNRYPAVDTQTGKEGCAKRRGVLVDVAAYAIYPIVLRNPHASAIE